MKDMCEAWIEGNEALLKWDGPAAQAAFQCCRDHADQADEIRRTPGYAGAKICLGQGTPELDACEGRAEEEVHRNAEFRRLTDLGEDELLVWKVEEARDHFTEADRLVDFVLQFNKGHISGDEQIVRSEKAEERAQTSDCIQRAEAEIARQERVKDACGKYVRELEANSATPAISRRDKTTAAAEFCEQALENALSTEGALRAQDQTPETRALNLLGVVAEQWKKGDDALQVWQGEDALVAYMVAKAKAEGAAGEMQAPTPGYVQTTSCKIELSQEAMRQLQECIAEAETEIERKNKWDGLVDEANDHLTAWRAENAVLCCELAEKLSVTCQQRPNQAELDEVAKLKSDANEELQRQKQVKSNFKAARKGLEVKRADRWKPRDNKTPIYFCEEALRHAASEEGELRSQAHLLQKREYTALELMLELCQEWKAGDEAMEDSRGVDAKARYDRCLQLANEGKYTVFTPGYYDDRAMKIQLTLPTDKVLEQCIADAAREIERREGIEATVKSGKERLEIVDRAAAHLQLPGRSGCRECRWSQHASQESPTLIISNVCHGCSPACPDAKGKDRWDIIKPHELEPVSAAVHSIEGAEEYLMAYEETRCEREKLEMVALLNEAADLLSNKRRTGLLDQERAAYADKARRTQNYLCTARGTSSKDLSARDGLGAGVAGWPGGSGLLDTLNQVAEWNKSEEGEMPWRRDGDPVITAERINDELIEALDELDNMDVTNQKIRDMPVMKKKMKAPSGASAPVVEFSMAEGDEKEEDESDVAVVVQLDLLDELVFERNRERKQAVELGNKYSATATRLSSQQKSVKRMAAHLSLYVTQLERRHAELLRWSNACHSWQLAGASEDQDIKNGVLKMSVLSTTPYSGEQRLCWMTSALGSRAKNCTCGACPTSGPRLPPLVTMHKSASEAPSSRKLSHARSMASMGI